MQTPTPLDRIARGQLVPSPAQRNPMASTSTPAYRPFASGAAASNPFRQTMAASALFRSRPSTSTQTPDRPREEGEQQVTRPESPYKVLSGSPSGGQINYSKPSVTPNSTPQKSASADVTRLSPASATAVGRARAAASLRRGLVIAFFWILLATARPYRYLRGYFADRAPLAFQAFEWLTFFAALSLVSQIGRSTYQLAIPGAAPLVTTAVLPMTPQQKAAQTSGSPAASSPSTAPFVKSSPKTRPDPPALGSPSLVNKSYTSAALIQPSSTQTPPPPKRTSPTRGSPSRFFANEGPPSDQQLRRSLMGANVGSQPTSALAAFQARQSPRRSFGSRRVSGTGDVERLRAEAVAAIG